ncbi:serine/threonine protein kinase [Streptomyces sp. TLI_55]|uniref:serine/threonine-protein kinase n=1 Tax=Streptomyces sp. TLI_55 TaxID=1938861 RepID=UPI000BCC4D6C|nr:serine/threonine-protein kinase [Streptomyces sp. TLI_55]SNX66073.1 serine/threonine protein kinase [Streptomyces sp. TLI_55]
MSEQRPEPTDDAGAALRRTGASPLRPGDPRRVGPWVPVALLGSGGMGRVYLARPAHEGPGLVAVKVIRPEYAEDPRFRRRFEREAAVHARLRMPYAPRLCGTGFDDDLLWMATDYIPGFDLAETVREDAPLTTDSVWRLVADLGQALAGLGAEDIVHRDLKPSNVLLSVHGAHVIDFGVSKAADASAITGTGNRVGTPAYMSPEHLKEGRSDLRSDVFSLAGTLVYAATGRAPFGDGTGVDVMHRVAYENANPEVLGEIAATDPDLGRLLTACLAKEPADRPTPQELIDAAAARTVPAAWPEPLGANLLARQQAYEKLRHLPVAALTRPSSPAAPAVLLSARVPSPVPSPVARPVPVEAGSRTAPTGPPDRDGTSSPRGRRALWIAAASLSACVLAAATYWSLPGERPATADAPETGTRSGSTISTLPGGRTPVPAPSGTTGLTRPDVDGAADKGVNSGGEAATSPTEAQPSAGADATADADPSDGAPAPTASPTPTAPTGTAPWLSDCTYYGGNGRTRLGDSGKRVQQVQCMLTKRGYGVGSTGVDGEFGTGTQAAVEAFQSDRGLDADGVVAHDTWVALRDTD